jgi:hypothetical protein
MGAFDATVASHFDKTDSRGVLSSVTDHSVMLMPSGPVREESIHHLQRRGGREETKGRSWLLLLCRLEEKQK